MNYHVHHAGQTLGIFPLAELRSRRATGEFNGTEYVWTTGMADWEPMDQVLAKLPEEPARSLPPPIPARQPGRPSSATKGSSKALAIVLTSFLVIGGGFFTYVLLPRYVERFTTARDGQTGRGLDSTGPIPQGATSAIVWPTNSSTVAESARRFGRFAKRVWVQEYAEHGNHSRPWDADLRQMLAAWVEMRYGKPGPGAPDVDELCRRLEQAGCDDPIMQSVVAIRNPDSPKNRGRLEQAMTSFGGSNYRAYPRFVAAVSLFEHVGEDLADQVVDQALRAFKESFVDGSFRPEDQREIYEILEEGVAKSFFEVHGAEIVEGKSIPAGEDFAWLRHMLDGRRHVKAAWEARGGGYADSVTPEGWQEFQRHLNAASADFTAAWKLHPDYVHAPALMMDVMLGLGDANQMRVWFDRAIAAEFDYPHAWTEMLWALRPRWYGSHEAMLRFGRAAVETGRFDTDIPRHYYDAVHDVESELGLPFGQYTFGQANVWPTMAKMYEGYVANTADQYEKYGWQTTYTIVAYLGGHYDVARRQLEAINWKPRANNLSGWGVDLTQMALEVGARTGPQGTRVTEAEGFYRGLQVAEAKRVYGEILASTGLDTQTTQFSRNRLAAMEIEEQLLSGRTVDFLPANAEDPGWYIFSGKVGDRSNGQVPISVDDRAYLLFCRARVGVDFEVDGEFSVKKDADEFEAGIVMGMPEYYGSDWYAFRMKRDSSRGDIATFAVGWSPQEAGKRAVYAETNSFHLEFHEGFLSATVNSQSIMQQVRLPNGFRTPAAEYFVGFGGVGHPGGAEMAFRNVRLHRLPPGPRQGPRRSSR